LIVMFKSFLNKLYFCSFAIVFNPIIMIFKVIMLLSTFCVAMGVFGQSKVPRDSIGKSKIIDGQEVKPTIINGDTVLLVDLAPITIMPPLTFETNRQYKRYSRLVLYVKKVYPYSQLVKTQLAEIHANLDNYKTEKEKKKYIDLKEKELKQEFEGQLRSLTFTQGKILIKLINRETGQTTFDIVKELKGSLNAYFWQSIARIFGSNLKMEYNATGDDIMIEDIVVRIENGEL